MANEFSCICGYKYSRGLVEGSNVVQVIEGDEPPLTLGNAANPFVMTTSKADTITWKETDVYLAACPKCKTVKVGGEIW
jgi:hypothetical protein